MHENSGGSNISGILVQSLPEAKDRVAEALAIIPGIEVHVVDEHGKIIITLEKSSSSDGASTLAALHQIPGVVTVNMVYHHFEGEVASRIDRMKRSEGEESAERALNTPDRRYFDDSVE